VTTGAASVGTSVGVAGDDGSDNVEHAKVKTSSIVKNTYFFILSPLKFSIATYIIED
jgi:hypothetical protein